MARSSQEKGFKKEVAAIKTVWTDDRMQVVVSEMTNLSDLRENIAASREPLDPQGGPAPGRAPQTTAHLYCHGCGNLCETARGVPVSTVLRYLRYYEVYGKLPRGGPRSSTRPSRRTSHASSSTPTSTPPRPPAPTDCRSSS